jgi:hypothetical protein
MLVVSPFDLSSHPLRLDTCRLGTSSSAGDQSQGERLGATFPTDKAAMKLLVLVLNRSEKEWKLAPREWGMAKAQFAVIFGEGFTRAMAV